MVGMVEGNGEERLTEVEAYVVMLLPDAECLEDDDGEFRLRLRRGTEVREERLRPGPLAWEVVRHAVVSLARAAMPEGEFEEWQHWASALDVVRTHGADALSFIDGQIGFLEQQSDSRGIEVHLALRERVAAIQAGRHLH